jgi:hypothetical protein
VPDEQELMPTLSLWEELGLQLWVSSPSSSSWLFSTKQAEQKLQKFP